MTAEERTLWLEGRRKGIGSSDAAKIFGLSPWGSPLSVYLEKVDPQPEKNMEPALEWGHRKEPAVAAAICDHYGWTLRKEPQSCHAEMPFLIANPDRVNQDDEICEIKNSDSRTGWGERDSGDVPDPYWIQVQHQMAVRASNGSKAERAWIFVLFGHADFRRYCVPFDPEYLPGFETAYREFWHRVETRTPPEPKQDDPDFLALVQRVNRPAGGTIDLLQSDMSGVALYEQTCAKIKELESTRDFAKGHLILRMGKASVANLPDGRVIKRSQVNKKEYTVKPSSYYTFSLSKRKGVSDGDGE